MLDYKKRSFELRTQVEDREQTVLDIEQELRSGRADALEEEIYGLRAQCTLLRDALNGKDVAFTAEIRRLRDGADALQQQILAAEQSTAQRSAQRHARREEARRHAELADQQKRQISELAALRSGLEEQRLALPSDASAQEDLHAFRSREAELLERVEMLRDEAARLEELLEMQTGGPEVGKRRGTSAAWPVRDPHRELNIPEATALALQLSRARAVAACGGDRRGCLLADLLRRADADGDFLLSADDIVAALRPLGARLTPPDVAPLLNGQTHVPWPDLLLLIERLPRLGDAPREALAAAKMQCVAMGVSRPAFFEILRQKGSGLQAYLTQSIGLSALHADQLGRAFDIVGFGMALPMWTTVSPEDKAALTARFAAKVDKAAFRAGLDELAKAGDTVRRLTVLQFTTLAISCCADADDDVAALFAVDGRVDGEAVYQRLLEPVGLTLSPGKSSGGKSFEDDFEDDFEDEDDHSKSLESP